MGCWNPYFCSFFECTRFWPSCQKREILDTHQKKKTLTDNWKALFGYFCVFLFSFFFLCFLFFSFFYFRATSPDPKPSLFVFSLVFLVLVFFFLELFIFECLPLFLLSLFLGLPLFQFLFLCHSLLLFFISSFLSFFLALFCFLVFVSFFPFLYSLLLFHEKNNFKILNYKVFLHQYFLFFGFLSCVLSEIHVSYLCFPDFKLCFVQHQCIWFQKKHKFKNTNFWSRGVAAKRFFFF